MSAAGEKIRRHLLLGALLGGWGLALAQNPPVEGAPAGPDAGSTAQPCVPAEDGGGTGAATEADEAEAAPCGEADDGAAADDASLGPAAVVEEDMSIEATADDVFKPVDEISEDYPIPLPSDI